MKTYILANATKNREDIHPLQSKKRFKKNNGARTYAFYRKRGVYQWTVNRLIASIFHSDGNELKYKMER